MKRFRRRMAICVGLALVPVMGSYTGYLIAPGDAPISVRSVDWLRDHGFESTVNNVEQWWYTRKKPTGTHMPSVDLPPGHRGAAAGLLTSADRLTPTVKPTQAGEGIWQPVSGLAVKPGAVAETFLRPDPAYPSVGATLVRIDQSATQLVLVPGTREPGGAAWSWGSQIPPAQRHNVIAAFNAGFKFRHTPGGVFAEGRHAVRPLQAGLASVIVRRDGTADVVAWPAHAKVGPDVASVRQNLHLIVDHGKPVAGLVTDRGGRWGTLRSQLQFTWRSGLGIDAQGRLIYAAGPNMKLTELAAVLTRAGAVRALQLDIHDNVVTFNWYRPVAGTSTGVKGSKLFPAMPRAATRYLEPDQRDFFAIVAR